MSISLRTFKTLSKNSMKTILLTWATGFLWSHLLEKLVDSEDKIFILAQESSVFDRVIHLQWRYAVVYPHQLPSVFESENIDIVIHLATCYRKQHNSEDIDKMMYANIILPTNLLELCAKYWVKKFINTWTFFEYDLATPDFSEKTREMPFNLYASTKLAFMQLVDYYVRTAGIDAITLRLFSPYWPRDNIKVIPLIIEAFQNKREISLQDISSELHFTFATDIASAYILARDYLFQHSDTGHEIINIWSEKSSSVKNIIHILESISWIKIDFQVKMPYSPKQKTICNTKKANRMLNWTDTTSLQDWLISTFYSTNYDHR